MLITSLRACSAQQHGSHLFCFKHVSDGDGNRGDGRMGAQCPSQRHSHRVTRLCQWSISQWCKCCCSHEVRAGGGGNQHSLGLPRPPRLCLSNSGGDTNDHHCSKQLSASARPAQELQLTMMFDGKARRFFAFARKQVFGRKTDRSSTVRSTFT
jgi:hypothetical protein